MNWSWLQGKIKPFWKSLESSVGSKSLFFWYFCVQSGQLFEAQWAFEECLKVDKSPFSNENVDDFEFLRLFRDTLCLYLLTNLEAKGTKRSVKIMATNFYKVLISVSKRRVDCEEKRSIVLSENIIGSYATGQI